MFQFLEINNIYWLLMVPLLVLLFIYGNYQKKKALQKFAHISQIPFLTAQFSYPKHWIRFSLVILATIFLVLTLMRPQGNPVSRTIKKKGRDLVFVIDVSKSMLAEDLKPNRLERAKQMVSDVLNILEGDRVGLLIFAGATAIKSPLTLDYNYFRNTLNRISPDDINRGGTHIGDAIRMVSKRLFYNRDNKYRDIILITDGEDHESFPIEAAEEAAKLGIKIHTIGLGNPDGANIPIRSKNTYNLLKYKNTTINSKLDESMLKKISESTSGVFIPVRTDLADLAGFYKEYIATAEKQEIESKESKVWSELYQFFLAVSIILLMIDALIGERRVKSI
ncbi:MAG: VWA domain-containing protein [Deltaproteobacteria bacterium]|jgi:Ca-activated chloride channel homolog|nr:VWA domain-containing protein [Deltaproteobacteria bacterium]